MDEFYNTWKHVLENKTPILSEPRFSVPSFVIYSLSCVWLFETPWTTDHQAPLSMRIPREEYWRGLPFPPPGDIPDPGIEPVSPSSLPLGHQGSLREKRRSGWQGMRRLDSTANSRENEFEQTPGDSEGQRSLVCCSPWGPKESDTTEQLKNSACYLE